MKLHFYSRQNSPSMIDTGSIEIVDSDAGAGIDDNSTPPLLAGTSQTPCATGGGNTVGTQRVRCVVVNSYGQRRLSRKAAHLGVIQPPCLIVNLSRGTDDDGGTLRHPLGTLLIVALRPHTMSHHPPLVEQCPFHTSVSYVNCKKQDLPFDFSFMELTFIHYMRSSPCRGLGCRSTSRHQRRFLSWGQAQHVPPR